MNTSDTINFEAVDIDQLRAAHERQLPPKQVVFPDGRVLTELNSETGAYKLTDSRGQLQGYTHAEHVQYMPSLTEQFLASRDTQPRLPVLSL